MDSQQQQTPTAQLSSTTVPDMSLQLIKAAISTIANITLAGTFAPPDLALCSKSLDVCGSSH
jgi:hypothetical protein